MTAHNLVVSFVTRPDRGGEGGVGWSFLVGAAQRASQSADRLSAIIDSRDAADVARHLSMLGLDQSVEVHAVPLPRHIAQRFKDRRSRSAYMAWLPGAHHLASVLSSRHSFTNAHQVTFATATLPPAIPRRTAPHRVWGPVGVPVSSRHAGARKALGAQLARGLARRNVRSFTKVIALNDHSQRMISGWGTGEVELEPNVVCEPVASERPREDDLLVTSGLLITRKRPWLAIGIMTDPRLRDYRLKIIGDGPLASDLQRLAEDLGVARRVTFTGSLPREEAVQALASARCLVHPSSREGSPWVVGEAAACGVPAVVFANSGAEATVRLSANGGQIVAEDADHSGALASGVISALAQPSPLPSHRWSAQRIPKLLSDWWVE